MSYPIRKRASSSTTGTAAYAFTADPWGSDLATGALAIYHAVDRATGAWEAGRGTRQPDGSISRDEITGRSDGGTGPVAWAAGTRDVAVTIVGAVSATYSDASAAAASAAAAAASAGSAAAAVSTHAADKNNPHAVTAAQTAFVPSGSGAVTRTVQDALRDGAVRVTNFGTLTDLTTNAQPAVQAAINAAVSLGIAAVRFPALPNGAKYFFPSTSPSLVPPTDRPFAFIGDGMRSSVLKYDEGSSSAQGNAGYHALFLQLGVAYTSPRAGRLTFRDLGFEGTLLDVGGRVNIGAPVLALNYLEAIRVERCRFYGISFMATACEAIRNVLVEGCEFEAVMRDQARFRSSFNVRIVANLFKNSDDDSVALHQASFIDGAGYIREGIVVADNVFEDTNGVAILGGRMVTVANNIFRRCKIGAVRVFRDSSEGVHPMFGISVTGNQAFDTLNRLTDAGPSNVVFSVLTQIPRAGSGNANLVAGANDNVAQTMAPWWNYRSTDNAVATDAIPPGYHVRITNNTAARTLPAVAQYSDWGFGQAMTNAGFANPAVTDAMLRPVQAYMLSTSIVGALVHGNIGQTAQRFLTISDDPLRSFLTDFDIRANYAYDCYEYGIFFTGGAGGKTVHATIEDNKFVLDPYRLSSGRSGGLGAWTSGFAAAVGVFGNQGTTGVVLRRNVFAECYQPTSGLFRPRARGNVVRCSPFTVGAHSTANYGVAVPPVQGEQFEIQVIANAGNSGAYGAESTTFEVERTNMPTSGSYYKGWFIRNVDPATTAVLGWLRITDGSNNIAGTDWKTVALT